VCVRVGQHAEEKYFKKKLTAAAKSICPGAVIGLATPPPRGADAPPGLGLGTFGIGGLPPVGFAAVGGPGFGLVAIGGGGLLAKELDGLELICVVSDGPFEVLAFFFHGVVDPLEGPIPGKTETGLADTSAATDDKGAVDDEVDLATLGGGGIGRRLGGGG
jgi:hypothetical protein